MQNLVSDPNELVDGLRAVTGTLSRFSFAIVESNSSVALATTPERVLKNRQNSVVDCVQRMRVDAMERFQTSGRAIDPYSGTLD